MKKLVVSIGLFIAISISAQENKCGLQKSEFDIYRVDTADLTCLAKNSDKKNTIFFTFARWCAPCLYHLPNFLNIEKDHNVDLYVLLIDSEGHKMIKLAKDYILEDYPNAKILVLKDKDKKNSKKYKDFIKEVTPSQLR